MGVHSNEGMGHCCACEKEGGHMDYHTGGPYYCAKHLPKVPVWAEPHNITWGHAWLYEIAFAGGWEEYIVRCPDCGQEASNIYWEDDGKMREWPKEPQTPCEKVKL